MDLSTIVPKSNVITVTLKYPGTDNILENDDKTPMTITLYAPHTKEYKAVVYEQANKRIKDQKKDFTIEDYESSSLDLLVGITKEWDITYGGEKPKLNKKKAQEIYSGDAGFWIVDQLQGELNSFEAFTQA